LLVSRFGRLPPLALTYLRLVGPAVLAALAAVYTDVVVNIGADGTRVPSFHVGIEWLAVGVAIVLVALKRSLLVGIVAAVAIVAIVRALNVA
jgi:branched-subunit amino acid transport protein